MLCFALLLVLAQGEPGATSRRKEAFVAMNHHPHHQQQHQHHQRKQHPQPSQQRSFDPLQQRREYLWRERVHLELRVQECIAYDESLQREWQFLATRKAALKQRRSGLPTQILFSGLIGIRQLPSERMYSYERERVQQEEVRLQQAMMQCQRDLMALHAQIEVIQVELSLLN